MDTQQDDVNRLIYGYVPDDYKNDVSQYYHKKDLSEVFPYEEIKDLKDFSVPKMTYNTL